MDVGALIFNWPQKVPRHLRKTASVSYVLTPRDGVVHQAVRPIRAMPLTDDRPAPRLVEGHRVDVLFHAFQRRGFGTILRTAGQQCSAYAAPECGGVHKQVVQKAVRGPDRGEAHNPALGEGHQDDFAYGVPVKVEQLVGVGGIPMEGGVAGCHIQMPQRRPVGFFKFAHRDLQGAA